MKVCSATYTFQERNNLSNPEGGRGDSYQNVQGLSRNEKWFQIYYVA